MRLSEIFPKLTAWFEPSEHDKRKLPGGGEWHFVKWQTIRDRLNAVCPEDWTATYTEITFANDLCIIVCTMTICQVPRQGVGSVPIEILNSEGKNTAYGDPVERAIADAFKNAAEQFGIAAYLDDQRGSADKKQAFLKYVSGKGQTTATPQKPSVTPSTKPSNSKQPATVSEAITRLRQIREKTTHTTEQSKKIAADLLKRDLSQRPPSPDEVTKIRGALLIDWSKLHRIPEDQAIAALAEIGDGKDEEVCDRFIAAIEKLALGVKA